MSTSSQHKAVHKPPPSYDPNIVEVKSKFECEFRRFSLDRTQTSQFDAFYSLVKDSHHLPSVMPFTVSYTDPRNGDLLPITNNDNLMRAYTTAIPLLRLVIYRKQDLMLQDMNKKHKNRPVNKISAPKDFRVVSSIVDADLLPDTVRRVKLLKHSSDRPLGFYIRDGMSVRVTPYGLEKVPGIFISRLVPGGLAEGTGLLAVNDEILEVNAIEVLGKSLDQVTDMMVANSQNLIITVKPASQPPSTPRTNSQSRKMTKSAGGGGATPSATTAGNKPIGNIGAKSMGDLPSVGATPPSSHGRLASVSTANGQKQEQSEKYNEEDRSLKRHSVSGVLDST